MVCCHRHKIKNKFSISIISALGYSILGTLTGIIASITTGTNFIDILIHGKKIPDSEVFSFICLLASIFIIPSLILTPLLSAATTIFKTAVYQYTLKRPSGPFSEAFIQKSFTIIPGTTTKV